MPEPDVREQFRTRLQSVRVIAVLRAPNASCFEAVAETLLEAGVRGIEVTMTTAGAIESVAHLARVLPREAMIGVGTIREPDQLRAAADAGAQFAVAPHLRMDLVETAVELGLPIIPGALSASEVVAAWEAGAAAVKIFPASSVGGPSYLRALAGPLPEIALMPSGGIGVDDVAAYLDAGAVTVGLGGPLMGDAVHGGDLGALAERARRAAAQIRTPQAR